MYRLYNMLDAQYRPLIAADEDDAAQPRPPLHPSRVQAFIYGCAMFVAERDAKKGV